MRLDTRPIPRVLAPIQDVGAQIGAGVATVLSR
jgi:hypothetical protein